MGLFEIVEDFLLGDSDAGSDEWDDSTTKEQENDLNEDRDDDN